MNRHPLRNTLLVIVVLGAIVALAILLGAFRSSSVAPGVEQPLSADEMKRLVPKGRELALAGDCFGCHSTANGPMAAGGVPIPTPFGTIYSVNITPDPTFGIGKYTRADFHRVIRDGVAPGGRNLYPAMPFVFTHITEPADIDALYAYMMSIPPIAQANRVYTGAFALPVRPFMNFWTLLNFPDRSAPVNPERSAGWVRGAYLVEGLGHCGACHSPRNFMMGVDFGRSLQGGSVGTYDVPPITSAALGARSFDLPSLTHYLRTGQSPQGTAYSGMSTVTHFSTSAMAPADTAAIATYLLTDASGKIVTPAKPPTPLPAAAAPEAGTGMAAGRLVYLASCAGCHGASGEGIPNVAPALKGNSTLAMAEARNLIAVVINGIPTQRFPEGQRMYAMPPFAHILSETQIADLSTWLRAEWGGHATPVAAAEVRAVEPAVR
ncbi:cytochrome c [Variovorax sp. J22P168]|uniref:cytochrome c n=1 Tax=Variovorax jilinensis TaxID=3053513 RepID=UPI0025767DA6|nr:cytochrome c [Variovorax sp. J22P168]MDM0014634.1 cytochrome c [Variovorax sp. J22P168]